VLSAITALAAFLLRKRTPELRSSQPRTTRTVPGLGPGVVGLLAATAAGLILRRGQAPKARNRCEGERDDGVRVCTEYEDRGYPRCTKYRDDGYHACAEYEDRGYNRCDRYEDQGYNRCDRYEDHGYSACDAWEKDCCDWWPCSWVCEAFTWICIAWVWVTNLVCVAWVWVSNLVCVVWVWVSNLVCVAWYWVTHLVCVAWIWVTAFVCKAWRWIFYPFCELICWLRWLLTGNEVSDSKNECKYGWTSAFRIDEGRDCVLNVTLRIRLNPDSDVSATDLANARASWEPAIENAWTGQFPLRRINGQCRCDEYRVVVNVQFVTSGEHHTVRVRSGTGRADMTNWFITGTGGTAAHDAGHMFGNPDEYPADECPDREVSTDGSIMRSSQTGSVRPRHYHRFAEWISAKTCCDYEVAG